MLSAVCSVGVLVAAASAYGIDWPQWRGPDRTGVSTETGLLKQWPAEGPKLLWRAEGCGDAHATPSVANGKIYGMGLRGEDEVVWARAVATGAEIWSTKIAGGTTLQGRQGGYGSRCTPTVDGNRMYVLGVAGELACLDTSGKLLWKHNLVTEFGGSVPRWGYSESPLVDGANVVVAPGGSAATIVAFNKVTGATAWKSALPEGDGAHYSSAISITVGGQRQIVEFLSGGVVGVSAADGKLLWRYSAPANPTANCPTPIFRNGHLFAASGYGTGGGLVKLASLPGGGIDAKEVYFTKDMINHHGGVVLVGDYLYGFDDRARAYTCIEFMTGKVMWANKSVDKGSVVYADGHLILRSEIGAVALIEATPTAYVEKGRFEQPDRSRARAWPHPVVANGRLYLRDMDSLLCYDIKVK